MLFERIVSEGLAHYSYIIGDKAEAVVIDPRRDCEVYIEKAYQQGMKIAYILETHRNEDYLIGSVELAARTGAEIWHADSQWNYRYGKPVQDGQIWKIGRLIIRAIHTPGHTPGMMNYLLHDSDDMPWIVFTGDTLFAGEVGRIDLLGQDRAPEMAGLIYDSIFGKLLPLGDEILVCPAHGAGSVCGESIADRLWTTIGIERKHNPRLQHRNRDEFVAELLKSQPDRPPYFPRMETLNLEGAPILGRLPLPAPLSAREFEDLAKQAFVLDTRMELSFASGHVPGAQSIWQDGLASFEGWFVPYDRPILLVNETDDSEKSTRTLIREGYDNLAGTLSGDMLNWHMSGLDSKSIKTVNVQELYMRMGGGEPILVLDVRSYDELSRDGSMPGALHIHITQLPERLHEIPKKKPIYVFCGSGLRSMIAASFLQRNGWKDLTVILGGMSAWKSIEHQAKK